MKDNREESMKRLRQLHEEIKKNPDSVLLHYQISKLADQLGLILKFNVSLDAVTGNFDYGPDPFLLKKGYYKEEFDFEEKDIIKQLYK